MRANREVKSAVRNSIRKKTRFTIWEDLIEKGLKVLDEV
jgi:hypothetical protein